MSVNIALVATRKWPAPDDPSGPSCKACKGNHPNDPPDSFVIFRGRWFRPPFKCLCCAKEICGAQFAFGRTCGFCDTGGCDRGRFNRYPMEGHGRIWNETRKWGAAIPDELTEGELDRLILMRLAGRELDLCEKS